jgi:hypothetical protein
MNDQVNVGRQIVEALSESIQEGVLAGVEVFRMEIQAGKEQLKAEAEMKVAEARRDLINAKFEMVAATLHRIAERKEELQDALDACNDNPVLRKVLQLQMAALDREEAEEAGRVGVPQIEHKPEPEPDQEEDRGSVRRLNRKKNRMENVN